MPKRTRDDSDEETHERDLEAPTKKAATTSTEPITDSSRPDNTLTHILSWNVETPATFLDLNPRKITPYVTKSSTSSKSQTATQPNALRALLARHNFPDFVCLQEVRARHTDEDWKAALKAAANGDTEKDDGPRYTPYFSLNRSNRGQRRFGVVTYAKDPSQVATAREVDWDAEGRVIILEMRSGWALINVYALNGSEAIYVDALVPAKRTDKTRNERKREFNKLLLEECKRIQSLGLRLVLIGDFNISLTRRDCYPRLRTEFPHALARKEFNEQFIPGANLVDIFRQMRGDRKGFSWFAKGKPQGTDCARVDYAW